jgi:hypothetical protein
MTNSEIKQYQETLDKFYLAEKSKIEYAQSRWQDEHEYENPEEYKKYLKDIGKKHNLNITRISLSYRDYSVKITIKFNDKVSGHIDIYETMVETSITKK